MKYLLFICFVTSSAFAQDSRLDFYQAPLTGTELALDGMQRMKLIKSLEKKIARAEKWARATNKTVADMLYEELYRNMYFGQVKYYHNLIEGLSQATDLAIYPSLMLYREEGENMLISGIYFDFTTNNKEEDYRYIRYIVDGKHVKKAAVRSHIYSSHITSFLFFDLLKQWQDKYIKLAKNSTKVIVHHNSKSFNPLAN